MKLPNRIAFNGKTYQRPTKTAYRRWKQPLRELGDADYRMEYNHKKCDGWITSSSFSDDEEGYSFEHVTIDFDKGEATHQHGGSDCDGTLEFTTDFKFINGEWIDMESRQYDAFAAAAGY